MTSRPLEPSDGSELTDRQASVLRAVVRGYVGAAAPIGSKTLSHLLPVNISSASIRSVLAELAALGLVDKPHRSAGRVPTELGLRRFVDVLLSPDALVASERREIAYSMGDVEGEGVVHVVSELLSRHTRQLGFVVTPKLDRVVLRHVSLVRLSSESLLVVLVSQSGSAYRRVIEGDEDLDQAQLDRIAALLNERVAGRTLHEVRALLAREAKALRHEANQLLARAFEVGRKALALDLDEGQDLVIETRLAILDQPEFHDPRRVRDLFEAIETKQGLLQVLDRMLDNEGVNVAFGDELEEPALRRCALVVTRYGSGDPPLGVLGVIGPNRMDYDRVIPLVGFLSEVMTGKLGA